MMISDPHLQDHWRQMAAFRPCCIQTEVLSPYVRVPLPQPQPSSMLAPVPKVPKLEIYYQYLNKMSLSPLPHLSLFPHSSFPPPALVSSAADD